MATASRTQRFPNEAAWLAQFDTNDMRLAEALLDTLRFVPQDEFVRWLSSSLLSLHESLGSPIAVYAVREPSGMYFPKHKGHRPTAVINKSVGSEAIVAQRVQRLSRGRRGFYSHPSITALRKNRIRDIVLVDDSVGSGDTVLKFLANMHEHRTIRSWVSRHLLRFWVVAFMVTEQGRSAITDALGAGRTARKYYTWIPSAQSHLRTVQRHRIRVYPEAEIEFVSETSGPNCDPRLDDLSYRYGRRFGLWYPFGYGEAFTLVAYDHGCPNTAPGILWESRGRWIPLFPDRTVTIPSGVRVPAATPFGGMAGSMSVEARSVLAELAKGTRHPSRIARSTGIPRTAVLASLDELRVLGIVNTSRRLTLRHTDLKALLPSTQLAEDITGDGATYIPTQLRGTSDAF